MLKKSIFGLLFLCIFCLIQANTDVTPNIETNIETNNTDESNEIPLRFKLGQMIIAGFHGTTFDPNSVLANDLKNNHISGIIFYGRNIQNPVQVKKLISDIENFSSNEAENLLSFEEKYYAVPPFIAIDHEGGVINHLQTSLGFKTFALSHATLGTLEQFFTFFHASQMAEELHDLGFNLNFAPVVDLKINPFNPVIGYKFRSFSSVPFFTATHALSFANAMYCHNIRCTLKHFPGHGSSTTDSHLGITDVTNTWSPQELFPYQFLVSNKNYGGFIMTAHVINQKIDSTLLPNRNMELQPIPMTFSKKALTDLLRNDLGFQGIIISDDLTMGAIAKNYTLEQALEYAINAGVDMIIFANHGTDNSNMYPINKYDYLGINDIDRVTKILDTLESLVLNGKIPMERIDEAFGRIMESKFKILLGYSGTPAQRAAIQAQYRSLREFSYRHKEQIGLEFSRRFHTPLFLRRDLYKP